MKIPGERYRANVAGLSAVCLLDGNEQGATLYYPRKTKLGYHLLKNAGSEREILANYIRQEKGWPRGENNMTRINFVSV